MGKQLHSRLTVTSFPLALVVLIQVASAFSPLTPTTTRRYLPFFSPLTPATTRTATRRSLPLFLAADDKNSNTPNEREIQWDLFQKYHAKGSWRGIWTTYDYIGDVMDETIASVNYKQIDEGLIQQTHSIVSGAKRSDCATCFDSMDVKEFPVRSYNLADENVFTKTRLGANAMVHGPSLIKSGVMATELVLAWGDGRVRVTFQHAPVWEDGIEPGSCPPQGLKLLRTMISREALRDAPPTAETEAMNPPAEGDPFFYRPVPPFNWHKKWAGTSWTWGPQTGDRGWAIEDLEEEDAWQGIATVERWNLRLPGGIFMQAPRVITGANAELCRLAWLPNDETLLRVEAGCLALQPMVMEDDSMAGFYPPSLTSLRCDVLKKMGELDKIPGFMPGSDSELLKPQSEEDMRGEQEEVVQKAAKEKEMDKDEGTPVAAKVKGESEQQQQPMPSAEETKQNRSASSSIESTKDKADSEPSDPRDILQL